MIYRGLSREENFCEFCGFVAIRESFLCEILGYAVYWRSKSEQSVKVFSANIYYSNTLSNFTGIDSITTTLKCTVLSRSHSLTN